MAKGDFIAVTIRSIEGPITVTASQNGRRVEHSWEKDGNVQWCEIKEVTRGGTTIRALRVPTTEIVAIDSLVKEID